MWRHMWKQAWIDPCVGLAQEINHEQIFFGSDLRKSCSAKTGIAIFADWSRTNIAARRRNNSNKKKERTWTRTRTTKVTLVTAAIVHPLYPWFEANLEW